MLLERVQMTDEEMTIEELYEKCRALISVISYPGLDENDRSSLIWTLTDIFELLGRAIGVNRRK